MTAVNTILCILLVFTAIGLACAVAIARSRDAGIGRRSDTPPDPFSHPFGDMPGFVPEQLRAAVACANDAGVKRGPCDDPLGDLLRSWRPAQPSDFQSAGLALRSDAGGGRRLFPSRPAAARHQWWRKRHA